MPATTPRSALTLDSADLEKLLTSMHKGADHDDADITATVQLRLRYLQRNSFPNDRAGRGKRATYDLGEIVRVLLAFELLSLDLTPQRAIAMVQQSWTVLARSVVSAWRALRIEQAAQAEPGERARETVVADTDALKRVAVVQPGLKGDPSGLTVGLLRPSALSGLGRGEGAALRRAIILDLFDIVAWLDAELRGEGFGYTSAEVDAAFERFGEQTFGDRPHREWLPPADE